MKNALRSSVNSADLLHCIERILKLAVQLAQQIERWLWVREVASLSPVSSNALVKIECA